MYFHLNVRESDKMGRIFFAVVALMALWTLPGLARQDSVKHFKNTLRINLSNPIIFSPKYNVIGYERVIRDYQSFSVSAGRFDLSKFDGFKSDTFGLADQYNDKGFNVSFDYRFYLKNENRYPAPRGIYLGPYYAFNYFTRDLLWELNTASFTGEVRSEMNLMANLIGVQLGCQFILWDRLSIDMILMGPGLWFFHLESDFETSLSEEDEEMLLGKLNEMLENKFPGSDLVIEGGGFEAKRTTRTSTMGLRYMVNLGFRF